MKDDKSRILPLLMDPRQPDENNRAYAYRILRKNIMNIQLQPGCQLSEAELSEHLVMSRTPIHEALMMLKGEWLVDVLPQRGSIVSKISIQYINEGYAMRKMLEPALLRSLSGHLNQAQLSELHGLLERQDGSACISHDVLGDYFITLDNEFHKRLYTYAGYDRIWQAMHNVTTHMDRVRYLDTALCQMDMETFRVEHEQLYKYLMVGLPKDVDVDANRAASVNGTMRRPCLHPGAPFPLAFQAVPAEFSRSSVVFTKGQSFFLFIFFAESA